MAEQAINTVYALGDHPDSLCDDLIKHLTIRTFTSGKTTQSLPRDATPSEQGLEEKDEDGMRASPSVVSVKSEGGSRPAADSFELAQLLFVVGHVAVKHLIYLELVERELKRQKGFHDKGERLVSTEELSNYLRFR